MMFRFEEEKTGDLKLYYDKIHATRVPWDLKQYDEFAFHYNAFQDSLVVTDDFFNIETASLYNRNQIIHYLADLQKKAPNGFIDKWDWNDKYGMITFELSFFNTNLKTIKYIDIYFNVSSTNSE